MKTKNFIKKLFILITTFGMLSFSLINTEIINAASKNYGAYGPSNTSNLTVPTVLKKGDCCSVGGKVTLNNPYGYSCKFGIAVYKANYLEQEESIQNRLSVSIKSASSSSGYYTAKTITYDLSNLDYAIQFNTLDAGKYAYTIYTCKKTSNNIIYDDYYTCEFVVDSRSTTIPTFTSSNIGFTDYTKPASINKGKYFILKGNVLELYDLYSGGSVSKTSYPCSMYASVINSAKKVVQTSRIGKFSASSCAFDKYKRKQPMPNNIDNEILFDKLDKGQYTLYYYIYHFKTEKYSDGAENYSHQLAKFDFSIV